MTDNYDAIVIGSGFGGAVAACRLAEKGYRVLILERGRRWKVAEYPRELGDPWIWDQEHPEHRNGWLDLRVFRHMAVAQGAGVGGGSLIYANISINAKPGLFADGWPSEVTYGELAPYYDAVGAMLDVQPVPTGQWPERTRLMQEAAEAVGHGDRFQPLDLAVTFDPNWTPSAGYRKEASRPFTNRFGKAQGTCVHLGNCDIGCDVQAKNTLDLNYIAQAELRGAVTRPLHIARSIEPEDGGYRVHFDRIEDGKLQRGSERGRLVVLAAGSLGSTELLLRCRDEHRTLPNISRRLGHNWSSNGDFLTPAFYPGRTISPSRGPTITSAIDFLDGAVGGHRFFIEDGGFPDVVSLWLGAAKKGWSWRAPQRALVKLLRQGIEHPLAQIMPWFAQGRDAANGRLRMRKRWWLFGSRHVSLDWDIRASRPTVEAIVTMHEELANATGGVPLVPPTWTLAKYLITPHPLGGCNMGSAPDDGVVDHKGEVFGYRNLFVADGAIVPEAIGANPSKTIAALSERIAKLIVDDNR
jgi:cholesterol oxidase